MYHIFTKKILLTLFFAAIIFTLLHIHLFNPKQENPYDSGENLVGAYTIAKYNIYSINADPHPASKREPLLPFLLSLAIKTKSFFVPHAKDLNSQSIESINELKIVNISILFMTIFLGFIFVYQVTKKYYLALYTLFTLIFSAALAQSAHTFLSEILSGFLCLLLSILLYFSNKWLRLRIYYVALGVVFSALVLTKAIYLYFIPVISVYLIVITLKEKEFFTKNFIKNVIIFSLCISFLVGGWMLRNYVNFDRFIIADRRAEVLNVRAEYDAIPAIAYPYFYIIWTPGLSKYYLTETNKAIWSQLVNDQPILDAYNNHIFPYFKDKKMNPNGSYNQMDYIKLEKIATQRITEYPWGHLKMTVAFLYRSIFVEDGAGLEYFGVKLPHENNTDKRVDNAFLAIIVNFPIWFGLFITLFYIIRRNELALLGLILIPTYTIFVYSLFAFSHYRYLLPLVPVLTIIFCLGMSNMIDSLKKRNPIKMENLPNEVLNL